MYRCLYGCRCGSSFDVAVVSDAFDGKMLIARHRLVRSPAKSPVHMLLLLSFQMRMFSLAKCLEIANAMLLRLISCDR